MLFEGCSIHTQSGSLLRCHLGASRSSAQGKDQSTNQQLHTRRRHAREIPPLRRGQGSVHSRGSVQTGPVQITLASCDRRGPQKTSPVTSCSLRWPSPVSCEKMADWEAAHGSPASLKAAVLTTVSLKAISENKSNSLDDKFTAEEIGSSFCSLLPNCSACLERLQGLLRGKGHV